MKENNKDKFENYLALYGTDFGKWPEHPSQDEADLLIKSQSYKNAQTVDSCLDHADWPTLSAACFDNVMQTISIRTRQTILSRLVIMVSNQRPALYAACIAAFLMVGMVSNTVIPSQTSDSLTGNGGYYTPISHTTTYSNGYIL